jgi:hypothetical protein
MTDLSMERLRLRDQWGSRKAKCLQAPAKAGMKAFDKSAEKQFQRAGLILLFVGEAAPRGRDLTSVTALMS